MGEVGEVNWGVAVLHELELRWTWSVGVIQRRYAIKRSRFSGRERDLPLNVCWGRSLGPLEKARAFGMTTGK
jgi:hypothetical protein